MTGPEPEGLGLATIMNPVLAKKHGATYVHLAAFAIDVDRAGILLEDATDPPPFGADVYLVAAYVRDRFAAEPTTGLLEDVVLDVLEVEPDEKRLGTQLPFAIYWLAARDLAPREWLGWFTQWRKPPTGILADVDAIAARPEAIAELAQRWLAIEIDPPFVAPVRAALEALCRG